jgi:hypothetical protein
LFLQAFVRRLSFQTHFSRKERKGRKEEQKDLSEGVGFLCVLCELGERYFGSNL